MYTLHTSPHMALRNPADDDELRTGAWPSHAGGFRTHVRGRKRKESEGEPEESEESKGEAGGFPTEDGRVIKMKPDTLFGARWQEAVLQLEQRRSVDPYYKFLRLVSGMAGSGYASSYLENSKLSDHVDRARRLRDMREKMVAMVMKSRLDVSAALAQNMTGNGQLNMTTDTPSGGGGDERVVPLVHANQPLSQKQFQQAQYHSDVRGVVGGDVASLTFDELLDNITEAQNRALRTEFPQDMFDAISGVGMEWSMDLQGLNGVLLWSDLFYAAVERGISEMRSECGMNCITMPRVVGEIETYPGLRNYEYESIKVLYAEMVAYHLVEADMRGQPVRNDRNYAATNRAEAHRETILRLRSVFAPTSEVRQMAVSRALRNPGSFRKALATMRQPDARAFKHAQNRAYP